MQTEKNETVVRHYYLAISIGLLVGFVVSTTQASAQEPTGGRREVRAGNLSINGEIGRPIRSDAAAQQQVECIGPGSTVPVTFFRTNTTAVPEVLGADITLTNLLALPGTCVINFGDCVVISASRVGFSATIPPGETIRVSFQAQVPDVPPGTTFCADLLALIVGGAEPLRAQACETTTCPAVGPGQIYPFASELSDQKAGSVLIYNLYSSSLTIPGTQNTQVSITNVHPLRGIAVHLFFVDGTTCSPIDRYICLTPNQTMSFRASEQDPGVTGYIVAVASSIVTGCPINFNYLIGDEFVKLSTGHAANLGAEAIAAIAGGLTFCNLNTVLASLNFDGVSYNRVGRVLALDNIPSRADGNDTLVIVNRIGGNLAIGAATLAALFGILYDDAEAPHSFSFTAGCQLRSSLSNSFPRTTPRFETVIPAGSTGWMKLWGASDIGILGAQINLNANAGLSAGAFNQGHNLHKLRLTRDSYVIPIFPPNC